MIGENFMYKEKQREMGRVASGSKSTLDGHSGGTGLEKVSGRDVLGK